MKDITCPEASHSGRHTLIYLIILLAILCLLALWPDFSKALNVNWLGAIHNTQHVALVSAILMVACLGCAVVILLSRLNTLQAARSIDSHAALHDVLTGAANRRQFEQQLEQLLLDSKPSHTLLMVDLDRFKPVNDLYGHAAGDALLREITLGIKRLVSHQDIVARLGGDEFAMLLPDKTTICAEQTAIDVLNFVSGFRLAWEGQYLSVGASIGLVHIDKPGLAAGVILAASDEALYAAKEAGRGAIFSADMPADAETPTSFRRISGEVFEARPSANSHLPEDGQQQELRARLMSNQFSVLDQERRRLHGARRRYEIRHWINVEPATIGNSITPGLSMRELISDASARSDGGADFARWVLAMALDAASRLNPVSLGRIDFVLPMPARAFSVVPTLADELMRSNALSYLPIRHLTFILHGVSAVYDSEALRQSCHRLRTSDVRLGYEIRSDNLDALAPLRHIPFDELHLGRELIKKLRPGTTDSATLDALLAVEAKSSLLLVAACVETPDEVNTLTSMGIKRSTGPISGSLVPLHALLAELNIPGEFEY